MVKSESGFSLLEAMIALTIGSLIVVLVSQVFLIQNDFYTHTLGRSRADDAVRVASELLLSEIRSAQVGGVLAASSGRTVLRSPLGIGGICDVSGTTRRLYLPGASAIDSAEVAGYAVRDSLGVWTYKPVVWSTLLDAIGTGPAAQCAVEGVDTTGISADFVEFDRPSLGTGPQMATTGIGDEVMVYREIEYEFAESQLDSIGLGLYRGPNGGTLVEMATGLARGTHLEYRVNGAWSFSYTGTWLDSIDALRVSVRANALGDSINSPGYTASFWVIVPLQGGDP